MQNDINVDEIGSSFLENAFLKANVQICGDMILGEDSGLCVDALNGLPGIYSARFHELLDSEILAPFIKDKKAILRAIKDKEKEKDKDAKNRAILRELLIQNDIKSSKAHFVSAGVLLSKTGEIKCFEAEGYLNGQIYPDERGDGGFGYDAQFAPDFSNLRLSEIADKNAFSHRFLMLKELLCQI